MIPILGAIPSAFIGGLLGDYVESEKGGKRYYLKGVIPSAGALIACIFISACFLIQINFWISIISLYLAALFSEVWFGCAYSIINKTLPSNL